MKTTPFQPILNAWFAMSLVLLAAMLTLTPATVRAEASSATVGLVPEQAEALQQQADEIDWNLRNSSISTRVTVKQMSRSQSLLSKARSEIAAGHYRTARNLLRQAAAPLVTMTALAPAHPDQRRMVSEIQAALNSITEGAAEIAREKGDSRAQSELMAETRSAIRKSQVLLRQSKTAQAAELLQDRYAEVQRLVALWRDGANLIVKAPKFGDESQWQDGLRRIDERKQLTEYLIIEAKADDIDPAPLYAALNIADRSVKTASDYAARKQWDEAFRSLDLAYVQIEATWKEVGLEW